MMPDFGLPVAGNITVGNPNQGLSTLSSLMNLQQQKQGIALQAAELQKQKQLQNERELLQGMMSSGKDPDGNPIKDSQGEIDVPAFSKSAFKFLPLMAPDVTQKAIQTMDARLKLNDATRQLGQNYRNDISGIVSSSVGAPDGAAQVSKNLDMYGQQNPAAAPAIMQAKKLLGTLPDISQITDPAQRNQQQAAHDNALQHLALQFQPASATNEAQQPVRGNVDTGGTIMQGTVAPALAGGGFTPQTNVEKSIPPQIVFNEAGQPVFVGSHAGTSAPGNTGQDNQFPASYDVAGRQQAVADMTNHFSGLNASAQSIPLVTALTKTISGLAPEAFTGIGGDKKQYVAGVLRAFGLNATGDSQTDTNLMNKAMAQLNISTPAGTDAARALVEAGQPNSKMDKAAIQEAAGTVAGQVKMNVAERNFLNAIRYENGGSGDPQKYQEGRQFFEQNADPRIWQYEDLVKNNPAQARAFIARQPDKADLVAKTRALTNAGFFK